MEGAALIEAYDGLKGDNAVLRTRANQSQKEADTAREVASRHEAQLEQITHLLVQTQHELAQLKRLVFGTTSERYEPTSPDQTDLFGHSAEEETETAAEEKTTTTTQEKKKRKKPARQVLPSHLPREEVIIEPEADTTGLKRIGSEVTETLDFHPARLVVIRTVRPKYADPKDPSRGVIIGKLPVRPIPRGIAEAGLLASILVDKFADHLPLYRQVQRFARHGLTLASSTIGDWTAQAATLLEPLYEALAEEARRSDYLQADETPIQVQDPAKKGKTHRGYYWLYHDVLNGLVVMDYQRGRGRAGPRKWLAGYEGALQTDGYTVYDEFFAKEEITPHGCMAHARRYFFEAKDSDPEWADHALVEIQKLFAIERTLKESGASHEKRLRVRKEKAAPLLENLKAWVEERRGLPRSPWGKATHYCLAQWDKLTEYTNDGRVEISNNGIENAVRPIAIGRKNFLFAGSHDAAQRAAVVYSLLATCKKHGVEPLAWLTDVLGRLPDYKLNKVAELLPHRWSPKA
jgi:transposase